MTIVLFIDYSNKYHVSIDDYEITDKSWYKIGYDFYENDVLLVDDDNGINGYYMIFDDNYVLYCVSGGTCDEDKYDYSNGKLTLFSDFLITKGKYDVVIENDILILSQTSDNTKIIHYFEIAKG